MRVDNLRNIAIIAHVDHGKTTMVDKLLRATDAFRANQQELPSVDLVVNARPGAGQASTAAIRASVLALWDRVRQRCARS